MGGAKPCKSCSNGVWNNIFHRISENSFGDPPPAFAS